MQSAGIRSYTKGRKELRIKTKTIYNAVCKVYGDNEVSFRLVRNWIRKCNSVIDFIKDTSRSSRTHTAVNLKTVAF